MVFFPPFFNFLIFENFAYFIQNNDKISQIYRKEKKKIQNFFLFFCQKIYEKLLKKNTGWIQVISTVDCDCDFKFIKPKKTIPTRYSKFPTMKGQKEQGGKKKTPTGGRFSGRGGAPPIKKPSRADFVKILLATSGRTSLGGQRPYTIQKVGLGT
jgi:hypothetical protein